MDNPLPERIPLGSNRSAHQPAGHGPNAWGFWNRGDPAKLPTLEAALASGINFIDTAEAYLFGGSEKTLGRLLPEHRAEVVLASKFFPYPWRLGKSSLRAALRQQPGTAGCAAAGSVHFAFPGSAGAARDLGGGAGGRAAGRADPGGWHLELQRGANVPGAGRAGKAGIGAGQQPGGVQPAELFGRAQRVAGKPAGNWA